MIYFDDEAILYFWSIKPILLRDCKCDGELGIEEEYWWSWASQQGKMEKDAKSNEKKKKKKNSTLKGESE